jgi:hypothetical protein
MKKSLAVITTCEVGLVRIDVTSHLPRDAGSRAIVLRSGHRHFSAGADVPLRSGISSVWSSFAAPGRKGL